MRFLALSFCAVLGAGLLFTGGASTALADSPAVPSTCMAAMDAPIPVATQPAIAGDAEAYELREAASPDVQDFAGGDVVIGVSVGFIIVVLLIILILSD
jgi:hypothetical protein